jgi:3-oxoacyl-[acyl-carrier protein] reductase
MSDSPVTLITGARRGLGRALAEHYLARGHHVFGVSRQASDLAHERYTHACADVTQEDAVIALFLSLKRQFDRLDHLINNAGIASLNHLLTTPMASVQRVFATNVFGTFLFCREAAKLMSARRVGRIVNVSTVAVPLQLEGEAAYASSKAAVVTLTQILARELAPFNITVNAVGPTPVDTDLIRGVPKENIQKLLDRQALHRMGTPADVANVVDFFLRPESGFVTAQTLYLGGVA